MGGQYLNAVSASVTVAALLWVVRPVRAALRRTLSAASTGVARQHAQRRHDRAEAAVERTVAAAQREERCVPVRQRGHNPVIVTWSDGHETYYFRDLVAYRAAVQSFRYPHDRTFFGAAPELAA